MGWIQELSQKLQNCQLIAGKHCFPSLMQLSCCHFQSDIKKSLFQMIKIFHDISQSWQLCVETSKHSNFVERTDKQTEGQHHFLSCSSQLERQENFYLVLNIWYLVTIEILCWCKITPILLQLQLFFLLQTKDSLTLNCLQSKLV